MIKVKSITVLFVALILVASQAGSALAAPALQDATITGIISSLECGANPDNPTVLVTLDVGGTFQTFEIDLATAQSLGIIAPDTACTPEALAGAIGMEITIDPSTVIPEADEPQHPVGIALSLFFSSITDYDTIMAAHEEGTGFGVLAQALWLTLKMEGDSDTFLAIVQAKKDKDFSAFVLEDGSTPQNWGQFKKAVLNGDKKANLGDVMSNKNKDELRNINGQEKVKTNNGNKNKDKEKKK